MKTLKICRLLSSVALTICYLMFVIPKLVNNDPNLVLIASVTLLVIGLPISLIARMKNEKHGREDCLMTFEDFLKYFGWRDLTFAIELKVQGVAKDTIDLLKNYQSFLFCAH